MYVCTTELVCCLVNYELDLLAGQGEVTVGSGYHDSGACDGLCWLPGIGRYFSEYFGTSS